ncbi:hypothetical protein [Frondihabitans cladoniiphilus]|uniref:Uncharacterized protein n=1 Tax=Frondihabitans cladoniiphilus TaxID=715785 RepID=A0ABP8VJ38_9MICO
MQLYSKTPGARRRQIAADVASVVGVVVFATTGILLAALIRTLGDLGENVASAGTSFETTLGRAARTLGGIPLVGGAASSPLKGASGAGAALAEAGRRQQELVGHVALAVGLVVALVPIAFLVAGLVARHRRFARKAEGVRMLAASDGGVELLAFRALSSSDSAALLRISPDPVTAWRAGDLLEMRLLAELTLREAGVGG